MPSPNEVVLTHLYSASTGLDVMDAQPNSPGPGGTPPATAFDLQLRAVAGNSLGGGGVRYDLVVTVIDETLGTPNAAMSSAFNERFELASGWKPGGPVGNFAYEKTIAVTIPAGVRGHLFRVLATLVSQDFNQVTHVESNRFILV
jgi:hypothetical protein